ncbi:hypothetical protein GCM10020218_008290 [Dactylosporangium vinaceum]
MAVSWRIRPSVFLVAADGPATVTFRVSHTDAVTHRAAVTLGAPAAQRSWFTLAEPVRDCPPGATITFEVLIRPDLTTPVTIELTAAVDGAVSEPVVIVVRPDTPWQLAAEPGELVLAIGWGPTPVAVTAAGPFGRRVRLDARTFTQDVEFPPVNPREDPYYEDPGYLTSLRIDRPERTLASGPETFTVTVLPAEQSGIIKPPMFVRFELADTAGPVVAAAGLTITEDLSDPELL